MTTSNCGFTRHAPLLQQPYYLAVLPRVTGRKGRANTSLIEIEIAVCKATSLIEIATSVK